MDGTGKKLWDVDGRNTCEYGFLGETEPTRGPWTFVPCLALDERGQKISPDARWLRINWSLVLVEALHEAGVRYEARPDFVAILGRFTKYQVCMLSDR
jgi:hypothetical protein